MWCPKKSNHSMALAAGSVSPESQKLLFSSTFPWSLLLLVAKTMLLAFQKFPLSDCDSVWWIPNAQAGFCCLCERSFLRCTTGKEVSRLVIPAPPPISEACRYAGFSIFIGFSYNYRRVLLVVFLSLIWSWPLTLEETPTVKYFAAFFSEPAQNHGSIAEGFNF